MKKLFLLISLIAGIAQAETFKKVDLGIRVAGSITVSDSGSVADDAFAVYFEGRKIVDTAPGATATYAFKGLNGGTTTFRVVCTEAPDDAGTLRVTLGSGLQFSDGQTVKDISLTKGGQVSYDVVVPQPPAACNPATQSCTDALAINDLGQGLNSCPGTPGVKACGEPVNVSTGAMWHNEQDFFIAGRTEKTSINFTRTYLANPVEAPGDFGKNWRHTYESSIKPITEGLLWINQYGSPSVITKVGDLYFLPPGMLGTVAAINNNLIITFQDLSELHYSLASNKLIKIKDKHGDELTLTYESGKLKTISSAFTGVIDITRNAAGYISTITRVRDNLSYNYAYNASGRLISVTDFANATSQYVYTTGRDGTFAQGQLEKIIDPLNRTLRFTYFDNGQAKEQFEPGGGVRSFKYGYRTTEVTEIDGTKTQYFFDDFFRTIKTIMPNGARTYTKYATNGQIASQSQELGGLTKYDYDNRGNVIKIQRALDKSPTQIAYDLATNVPTSFTPLAGAPTSFTLDALGDVTKISRGNLELNFTRDSFGNVVSINNGLATYADIRNADGLITTKFDLHNPEIRSYDSRNRLITRQFASGRIMNMTYDDYDRVTDIIDSHGPDTHNIYDIVGRVTETHLITPTETQITKYLWDARDRLVKVTDAQNRETNYTYDTVKITSNPISVTDPAGRITKFKYDDLQRLTETEDANGQFTKYTYNEKDQVTSVTAPNGDKTVMSYDANGRLIRESRESVSTNPTTGVNNKIRLFKDYFYDAADRINREDSYSNPGNRRVTYFEYDELDRLIRKDVGNDDESTYTYSPQLDATLITSANNKNAALNFQYENKAPFSLKQYGQAPVVGSPLDVIEVQLDITRDTTGQVATLTALDAELGEIYSKTHDAAGRLTAVNSLGFSGTITYDAFGRQSQVNLPNNSKQVIYDTLNRVTGITWTGDTPISQQLTYNTAGNINAITRENTSYQVTYDNINQLLTSATTGTVDYNKTFQYDSMGNRTTNGSTYVSNFLTQNSTTKFDSDANGFGELTKQTNLSNNQFRTYQYRADGRMKELNRPAANLNVKYYYDALGRRIAKIFTEGSNTYSNYYFHEGLEDKILISVNGNDQPTFYIDGQGVDEHLGEVILSRMSRNARNTIKAYVTDHLGSVLNSDMAGTTKSFGLFGEPTATVTQTMSTPAVRYGYTGREWDAESSTSYHRARNYDPNLGRWLTPDPIGLAGGDLNLYRYVGNNSINYTDPTGFEKKGLNEAQCKKLLEKIENLKRDISKRTCELADNPLNLPYDPPYEGAPPKMSQKGHEEILKDRQENLQRSRDLYNSSCGGKGGGGSPAFDASKLPMFVPLPVPPLFRLLPI